MKTLLKPEQINSKFLKKELMKYLYYRLGFPIIVDEHEFMDVFGVRRTGYMIEYEIKVSKADLLREINLMKCEQPAMYSKEWNKWQKHAYYLRRKIDRKPHLFDTIPGYSERIIEYFIPNEFYFYVPDFLAEIALRETVNTPYGVITIGERFLPASGNIIFDSYNIRKIAQKFHNNKVDVNIYRKVAHELTIRNRIFHT